MNFKKLAIVVATAALVGACGGLELQNAQTVTPKGDAFSKALYGEYIALSKTEYGEGDYADSDVFAMRAVAAASGKAPAPEEVKARHQSKKGAKALGSARARLEKALAGGAGKRMPAEAAKAQAMYECWAQELEENRQPAHIDGCRIGFFIEMAKLEGKPAPKAMAMKAKLSPLTFLVYFGFNSATLDSTANSVVSTASDVIKDTKPKVVSVIGHTDKSGATSYNAMLAEKRANAVAAALGKMGVSGRAMTIGSLGENAPAVATPDGAKESGNRRVEVTVRY